MANYFILVLPLITMPLSGMVINRFGRDFTLPRSSINRLRLAFATGCYTSVGVAAAFPHVPFIHASWALASLGMFSTGLDANLAMVGRPGALRPHWPWLVPAMLAAAALVGVGHPQLWALGPWGLLSTLILSGSALVWLIAPERPSPATHMLLWSYLITILGVFLGIYLIAAGWPPFWVDLEFVVIALSAFLMGLGALVHVLEGTTRTLAETRDRIAGEVAERTAELQAANAQLRELDRMKDRFLSTVSHELRTPLTAIQGYGEFLEDEIAGPLGEGQRPFVAAIMEASSLMSHKVDDLLDLASISAGALRFEREPLRYDDLLEKLAPLLHPILQQRRQALQLECPMGVNLEGDHRRLQQVLINLVQNAAKFSPEGAEIRVIVSRQDDGVLTRVIDPGIGIPREHLEKIFQAFYQVDGSHTRPHGGIGMGLSIVHSLVTAHGGWVRAQSEEGHGAEFSFWLPCTQPLRAGASLA